MRLKLLTPTEVVLDEPVDKVVAEAENGFFCLLPHHVDFVAALVPGILYYYTADGTERLAAVDQGTLVKCADQVLVSVLGAVQGTDLGALQAKVEASFRVVEEEERRARSALARLEAATLRGLADLERRLRG
jgi:F-type H+-transporting ATPase subunit epsilon